MVPMDTLANVGSIGTLVIAGLGALGVGALVREWYVRRRTNAEADRESANARLADAQAESFAVGSIKEALTEVRSISTGKDAQIAQLHSELDNVRDDIKALQKQGHRIQVALAAHGQWDIMVVSQVRAHVNPDFPDPPPLHKFDPWTDSPNESEE